MDIDENAFTRIRLSLYFVTVAIAAVTSPIVAMDIFNDFEGYRVSNNLVYLLFFLIHFMSILFRGYWKSIVVVSSSSSIIALAVLGLFRRIEFFHENSQNPRLMESFFVSDNYFDIAVIAVFASLLVAETVFLRSLLGEKA